jgi:hypothetical protein
MYIIILLSNLFIEIDMIELKNLKIALFALHYY